MASLPSDYDTLRQELEQDAMKFPAEPGDNDNPEAHPGEEEFIAGEIIEVGVWRSREFEDSTTIVVRDEKTGLRIHYASPSIPRRFFDKRPPRVGDMVAMFYGGLRPLRSGGVYHHYNVRYLNPETDDEGPGEETAASTEADPSTTTDEFGDDIPFD